MPEMAELADAGVSILLEHTLARNGRSIRIIGGTLQLMVRIHLSGLSKQAE